MKLNIYHSDLNSLSANKLLETLKKRDKAERHIIISPDKSSLYYERRLFDVLKEDSFFDISVMTLSRFANRVINKHDKILSKQGGVLIVKKILMDYKSELKSFSKSSEMIGFAGSLFDTICMFKSCHIEPSQIEEVKFETLNNKLKDIKLVYEKYEEYLRQDYTDSFNRLNLCADKISKDEFENTNFYFVGFDDFTKQGYQIIEKLIRCSKSVSVATTFSKKNSDKDNSNIYINQIYLNLIDLANLVGINCNIIKVENDLNDEKKFLSAELLGNKVKQFDGEQNYVKLIKYNTIEDEVKNTCLNIKYSIINNGLRYKNFAIIVSDLNKYKFTLIDYLNKLNINYFIDESKKLIETTFSRFVSNIISVLYKPTKYNVELLIKSIFLDINPIDIDKYLLKIEIFEPQYDNLFKTDIETIKQYFDVIYKYRKSENCSVVELLENILNILNDLKVFERIEELLKKYYENNELEEYRLLKQSVDKTLKIFDDIKVISQYKCGYQELMKFFDLFCENTSIVVPPIVTDAVFISNLECENLNDIDYVFFLGFNEGVAPRYNVDSGIISDDEINKMPLKTRLNPTINVINKRLKFKLFELVFVANKQAVISYPEKLDGEAYPNAIINSLKLIYGLSDIQNGSYLLDNINNNLLDFNKENFVYNNFSSKIATDNYVKLLKYWDNYSDNKNYVKTLSVLDNIVGDSTYLHNQNFDNNLKPISSGLFLQSGKVGLSQIERFNTCPYMHFIDYGLKLKRNEKNDLSAIDLGNIIHEFVKNIIKNLEKVDIFAVLDKILAKDEYMYLVKNEKNKFIIKALYEEAERIHRVLKYQQGLSSFKPTETELPIKMQICKLAGKDIYLTGIVDRVDRFNNGIRVIDYKTGNISFKNYDDIYVGNKIQVIVYLSILSKEKQLKPLGALYLLISNAFASDKCEDLYQMQGIIENSLESILAYDKNLNNPSYSSSSINLSTTTKGEILSNSFYKNMCLSGENISKLSGFVLDLVRKTICNVNEHIINPNPIDERTCEYCEYKGLCNFSVLYNNQYREVKKVKTIEDLLEVEDE